MVCNCDGDLSLQLAVDIFVAGDSFYLTLHDIYILDRFDPVVKRVEEITFQTHPEKIIIAIEHCGMGKTSLQKE